MAGEKRWPSMSAWHSGSRSRCSCGSVQLVAMRHQQEHQRLAAPIPAQGHGLVGLYPARVEHHCPSPQYPKMSQLGHAIGGFYTIASSFACYTCNLKPPPINSENNEPSTRERNRIMNG